MTTDYETKKNGAPILFDGHGHDTRYNGPLSVSPTVSAAYGGGGGNIPLVICTAPAGKLPAESGRQGGFRLWHL